MPETPLLIERGTHRMVAMSYRPGGGDDALPVLVCNAFGDERKSSCLALVRLARALAAAGRPVLRFDYTGCGDSPGDFVDASARTRLDDIVAAADRLQQDTASDRIVLLGLRLGATLAASAAERIPACAGLVLIEPLPDGAAYFDGLVRRRKVRQMMTAGQADGDAAARQIIDLDGYAVRPATLEGLRALRLAPSKELAARAPALIVQATFNEKLRRETVAARNAFVDAGARVDVRALVLPPFWSRIDITDTTPLDEAVVAWPAADV